MSKTVSTRSVICRSTRGRPYARTPSFEVGDARSIRVGGVNRTCAKVETPQTKVKEEDVLVNSDPVEVLSPK